VVEFGTSFGVSTLWLAAAVRDNGGGMVVGTELIAHKAEQARANVREAGLGDYVDIRTGNALDTLRDLDGPVDLLLNDGFPAACLDVLKLVTPALRPGAVVIADNVGAMRGDYADYVEWIRDPANGFVSVRFLSNIQLIILCSNCVRTSADLAMSPMAVGLRLTCWMARHRWDIRAKPRSPW
jgi:predicted O-methyltransferase YrrM